VAAAVSAHDRASRVEVLVCDFGGVLTSPLMNSFAAFQDSSGVPLEALGRAMAATAERDGAHPLFELEKGHLSERDFLGKLEASVEAELGRPVAMHDFAESYFAHLETNHELLDFVRDLRSRGLRAAILTNNVKEWEPRWRAMIPVDEVFEMVIDSAFVGMRKPEREIYELTLERLGVAPEAAVLLDDIEINCAAAREAGMRAVWFRSNDQAIHEIEQILAGGAIATN
jgi:epoxide hydrolase-like predicted phosphatase